MEFLCLSGENRAKELVVIEVFIERRIRCIVRFVLATAGVNHHVCLWNPYVISKPVGVSSVFQRIPDVRPNPPLKGKREGLEKAACDMTSLFNTGRHTMTFHWFSSYVDSFAISDWLK